MGDKWRKEKGKRERERKSEVTKGSKQRRGVGVKVNKKISLLLLRPTAAAWNVAAEKPQSAGERVRRGSVSGLRQWPLDFALRGCSVPPRRQRHALRRFLRVSPGRVVRAVASCGPGCVLWDGADSAVPVHALEHDQDAEPPPSQHAGQRGSGHRTVRGVARWGTFIHLQLYWVWNLRAEQPRSPLETTLNFCLLRKDERKKCMHFLRSCKM